MEAGFYGFLEPIFFKASSHPKARGSRESRVTFDSAPAL